MSAPFRLKASMAVAMAIGLAYVVWLAWAEGWRLWVVLGVMAVVGLLGGAVHLAMGLARERDGLEGNDEGDRIDSGASSGEGGAGPHDEAGEGPA